MLGAASAPLALSAMPPRGPGEVLYGPHYSTLMPRFNDGPLEPAWVGPRTVCVSQGSTGTHGFFDAAVKLGLPAAHWFDQHRAGNDEIFSVRYERQGIVYRKVGASIFPGHDAMLAQYDLAKACATPNSGLGCPEPGAWADATEAALRDVAAGGFSASDVPYAAVPLLLASTLRGNGTVFVHLKREAHDWAKHRVADHSADGDPICNRSLWADIGSPLDLHTCARRCAAKGMPGKACFGRIEDLPTDELARAYEANEALLSDAFPDAVVFDMLDGAAGAQWSKSDQLAAAVRVHLAQDPESCDAYLKAEGGGGCKWTERYACPGSGRSGSSGTAVRDESEAFRCCCEVRCTSDGGGSDCDGDASYGALPSSSSGDASSASSAAPSSEKLGPESPCVLLLVVSCAAHSGGWPKLRQWADARGNGACGTAVIVTARVGDAESDARVAPQLMDHGVLRVGGQDDWEHLPEKMLRAHHAVSSLPALSRYTHVLKMDDTDVGYDMAAHESNAHTTAWKDLPEWTLAKLEHSLAQRPQQEGPLDYCGPVTTNLTQRGDWHIHHQKDVPMQCPGSYWCGRAYPQPRRDVYVNGGTSYMMSRKASAAISAACDITPSALEGLYHSELYEDVITGHWLEKAGFLPERWNLIAKGAQW